MRVRRPSPAMVVALVALFVALGGSSYAVTQLPKNSVGAKQLKRNAVNSAKVKQGSLLLSDFKQSQRTRLVGPQGPQGIQGPQGPKGDAGAPGATNVVIRRDVGTSLTTNGFYVFIVDCEPGERAVGGGAGFTTNAGEEELQQSYPSAGTGEQPAEGDVPTAWVSIIKNYDASPQTPVGYAVCVRP